jgi:hypothetical protein
LPGQHQQFRAGFVSGAAGGRSFIRLVSQPVSCVVLSSMMDEIGRRRKRLHHT